MNLIAEKVGMHIENQESDAEGIIDHGRDFNEIIDYLNDLINQSPQLSLNLGEIRFRHKTVDETLDGNGHDSAAGGSMLHFEAERLRSEADTLRNEVDDLKLKIARLIAQLNDTECNHDALLAENTTLKAQLDSLQIQLERSRTVVDTRSGDEREDSETEPVPDTPRGEDGAAEDAEGMALDDGPAGEIAVSGQSNQERDALQDSVASGTTVVNPTDSPAVDSAYRTEGGICAPSDKGSVIFARQGSESDQSSRKPGSGDVIFTHKSIVLERPVQRESSISNIIKRDHVTSQQPVQEGDQVLTILTSGQPLHDMRHQESVIAPDPVQEQHVSESEDTQPDHQSPGIDVTCCADLDDAAIEPVPDSELLVRQHLNKYKTLQDEADLAGAARSQTTIIL